MEKTLILDGAWNLKRNFLKRENMFAKGEHCGGSFGFLESLRSVVNRVLPSRCIVMWDGKRAGLMRYEIFPGYKENRDKDWSEDAFKMNEAEIDFEAKKKYSSLLQQIKVKNYLEELYIRQIEVDTIEADDLIAKYVLTAEPDEEIIIFSADRDYYQLISDNVSVLRPSDNLLITNKNFKDLFGHIVENSLILKCFSGDDSDCIPGVDGVAIKSIMKYFPRFAEEVYDIDRFIKESVELYQNKKIKLFEKIIGSRRVIERNDRLMNLKHPMLNQEAINEVDDIRNTIIAEVNNPNDASKRSITTAMKMCLKDGYDQHIWKNDMELFFRPFYRLVAKETEFSKKMLNEQ